MDNTLLLEHGPITMTLEARKNGAFFREAANRGAEAVLKAFNSLVESPVSFEESRKFLEYIDLTRMEEYPEVLRRMIASVSALEERSFTPMAAVAGTLSDIAVEAMSAEGADYAAANNGGDIAFRLSPQKSSLNIGIISDLRTNAVTHMLRISKESGIGGLATSGFGGRSLTLGIASAVTALSASSSYADAAATSIANACNCEDPGIERSFACELDAMTDIAGLRVTRSIGVLRQESLDEALRNGEKRAEELCEKGLISGAVIFISGKMTLRWRGSECPFKIEAMSPLPQ